MQNCYSEDRTKLGLEKMLFFARNVSKEQFIAYLSQLHLEKVKISEGIDELRYNSNGQNCA